MLTKPRCTVCGRPACIRCRRRLPRALLAACARQGWYALGLANGKTVVFTNAAIHGDWIYLDGVPPSIIDANDMADTESGLEVRLSAVVWAVEQRRR